MSRTTRVCVGALYHSPIYYEVDSHHIFPRYMAGLLGIPERPETAILCATDHDNLHAILKHLINEGTMGGHRPAPGLRVLVDRAWSWWQEELR